MTAIPRFTQTDFLSPKELALLLFQLLGVLLVLCFSESEYLFWFMLSLGWIYFIWFGSKRFINRKQNPPFTFVFVAIGVASGFLGTVCLSLYHSELSSSAFIFSLGKVSFFDTMILALVIGVGGRLIPGILGFQEIVNAQREIYETKKPFLSLVPNSIYFMGLLFLVSIFLEVFEILSLAYTFRALVVSYIAFVYWRIQQKPEKRTWHSFFIRTACWFLLVASWLLVFLDEKIAVKHLSYIGSYTLLTFMIASRVVLAHSSEGLELEKKLNPYAVVGLLFVAAALTRATANYFPTIYTNHLGYAALCFLLAGVFWGFVFLPKIIHGLRKTSVKP